MPLVVFSDVEGVINCGNCSGAGLLAQALQVQPLCAPLGAVTW